MRKVHLRRLIVGAWLLVGLAAPLRAQRSETLLPPSTKGFLSVLDMDELRAKWEQTELGQLVNDPVMEPFIKDLQRQIKNKLSQSGKRLGITWNDLEGVYGGEVSIAVVQPDLDKNQHAMVFLVDVTGHREQAVALREKIWRNQQAQGATRREERMASADVTVFTFPAPRQTAEPFDVYYAIYKDRLIAVDHREVLLGILQRLDGAEAPTLAEAVAFQTIMSQGQKKQTDGEVRWFVEPFGYTEVARAVNPPTGRKTDFLKVLSNQGFREAVLGLGGHIFFATGDHEIMHRTLIYSPPAEGDKPRYRLAARMLDLPNRDGLVPQSFIPETTATYITLSWKMKEAFEHSKTLVNELIGAEEGQDLFEEVLQSMAKDPDGPRVDIRKDLVAYLRERATLISEPKLPITPKSERLLVLVEVTDTGAVRKTIDRLMENEEGAKRVDVDGIAVWEIVPEEPPVEVPELEIEGFDPFGNTDDEESEDEDAKSKLAVPKHSAITVADGHLILANHVDYLIAFLKNRADGHSLAMEPDYRYVQKSLDRLGAGKDAVRFFTRTDRAYRTTYELLRQGRMPESESLLGKLLNRLLTDEDADGPRKQQIDGKKMPPFAKIAKYLGPAGSFVQTVPNGWFASGCLLRKDQVLQQADASGESQAKGDSGETRR